LTSPSIVQGVSHMKSAKGSTQKANLFANIVLQILTRAVTTTKNGFCLSNYVTKTAAAGVNPTALVNPHILHHTVIQYTMSL